MSSKLKEALSKASIALSWAAHHHLTEDDAKECLEIVDAALDEPLRNCEVGTAEEQIERFGDYCCEKCDGSYCKNGLYIEDGISSKCAIKWMQMPYEKGSTK